MAVWWRLRVYLDFNIRKFFSDYAINIIIWNSLYLLQKRFPNFSELNFAALKMFFLAVQKPFPLFWKSVFIIISKTFFFSYKLKYFFNSFENFFLILILNFGYIFSILKKTFRFWKSWEKYYLFDLCKRLKPKFFCLLYNFFDSVYFVVLFV